MKHRAAMVLALLASFLVGFGPPGAASAQGGVDWQHAEGLDMCHTKDAPTLNSLYLGTPFLAMGVYVGGENGQDLHIGCYDPPANVAATQARGFGLIPFWYGLQPGCTTNGYVTNFISPSSGTAYNQGITSAKAAIATAQSEGLGARSPLYLDVEAFSDSTYLGGNCRLSAKSYVSGWVDQIRDGGSNYIAGMYGSACASYVSDDASISHVPDAIVAADNDHNPLVSVEANCIPTSYWSGLQRIKQFAAYISLGGISVDEDCIYGPVVALNNGTYNNCKYYASGPIPQG
jgi:hypothetical protein